MQSNQLLGLMLKLLKLLRIAWSPFLVLTHQPLVRRYNQDCCLSYLLLWKQMKETGQELLCCHNLYQTIHLKMRAHLMSKKTQTNAQHQMYALSLTPFDTWIVFCLTTILSVLPHRQTCLFIFHIYWQYLRTICSMYMLLRAPITYAELLIHTVLLLFPNSIL